MDCANTPLYIERDINMKELVIYEFDIFMNIYNIDEYLNNIKNATNTLAHLIICQRRVDLSLPESPTDKSVGLCSHMRHKTKNNIHLPQNVKTVQDIEREIDNTLITIHTLLRKVSLLIVQTRATIINAISLAKIGKKYYRNNELHQYWYAIDCIRQEFEDKISKQEKIFTIWKDIFETVHNSSNVYNLNLEFE